MRYFKSALFSLFFLASAMAHAARDNTNWNIKIFNDSDTDKYYLVTDLTFVDPYIHPEMMGILHKGEQTNIVLQSNENHRAGRVYFSDKPINYKKDAAPGLGDEYNFVEYTVGTDKNDKQQSISFTDYDVSGVDSLYRVPFKLEAVYKDGTSDGWVGIFDGDSGKTDDIFNKINLFTQQSGWPTFANSSKIPGAYNMFALSDDQLSPTAVIMRQTLLNRWLFWTSGKPADICKDNHGERSVDDCVAFATTVQNIKPVPNTNKLLAALYGYVPPYNYESSPYASYVIALLRGLSFMKDQEDKNPAHLYPDYNSIYCLNPYVTFIHKYLNLQIYAFSIDDSIGNIYQPDVQDLYIDLGSDVHLPNKKAYVPKTPIGPSDFVLSYAPNWGGYTFVLGSNITAKPTDQANVVPFNLADFDLVSHQLNMKIFNNTLSFSADITVDPATKVLTKANCKLTKAQSTVSDPLCNDFANDTLGAQMNMDNVGHAIVLPPGR
jgi:hypothetical protein